ncbi:MAG: glycosyltransferase [Chitinophagaceae bacterium]|nr:glycosyltransferase [Chitinophagaceae bacterium]
MKILIVTTSQFGYLVDYYRYYTYLKGNGHSVRFICWDFGKPRIEEANQDIIYVSREGKKITRLSRFIQTVQVNERQERFDRILINWFKFMTTLLFMIPSDKMYIDIRTVSVDTSRLMRKLFDTLIWIDAKCFKHISILTDSSARRLGLKKYKLLPLGGARFLYDKVNGNNKYADLLESGEYDFLYVGTLHLRRIIDCVKGFHAFVQKHPGINTRFIIIGDAIYNELTDINSYIADNNLGSKIITTGYIPQHQLAVFFKKIFCGVSFVPIVPHFDVQPSTKTYEYLINGIPVIATSIQDNIRLIQSSSIPCGVLIKDNPADFEKAVGEVIDNKHLYNKEAIAEKFGEYEWDNLLRKYLDEALNLPKGKAVMAV